MPLPTALKVAIYLLKLEIGCTFLHVSVREIFAIGKSTVHEILTEVIPAINGAFKHVIQWPSGPRILEIVERVERRCRMPNCLGFINATHIQIIKPKQNGK